MIDPHNVILSQYPADYPAFTLCSIALNKSLSKANTYLCESMQCIFIALSPIYHRLSVLHYAYIE